MTLKTIIGLLLVSVGFVSLIWGGVPFTRERTAVNIGPIQAIGEERDSIPLPRTVGLVALVAGVVFLVAGERSRI